MSSKKLFCALIYVSMSTIAAYCAQNKVPQTDLAQKQCTVHIESLWKELETPDNSLLHDEKLVVIGKITFRNQVNEIVKLDELQLNWHGSQLNYLLGSLYKANLNEQFLPIDSYLICDSIWNKKEQMLTLKFNKPENLGSSSTFYVVLTIPHTLEPSLKQGHFQIATHNLPTPCRTYAQNRTLQLAMR